MSFIGRPAPAGASNTRCCATRASRNRWILAALLGPAVWLAGYVVLPLAKVYKPIWKYDAQTLRDDLSAHVVYGVVTATAFGALARDN